MKKVFLMGDSVRETYDVFTKKALADTCDVVFPEENCKMAEYVLRCMTFWNSWQHLDENVDLVHFNAGLWDVLHMYDDDCLTPVRFYEFFIDKICGRIKRYYPKAKVIFATTTPVIEPEVCPKRFYRKNEEIKEYNKVAVEVCKKHGFYINDLYEVVKNADKDIYIDNMHMSCKKGAELLTNAVVKSISEVLGIDSEKYSFDSDDEKKIQEIASYHLGKDC